MNPKFDLTGKTFGQLTVVELVGSIGNRIWRCLCECGTERLVPTGNLKFGNTTSCGCARTKKIKKHGMNRTKIYAVWSEMKARCDNPKNHAYANYGGRGITYDPRWSDFVVFYEEMGNPPFGGTLEREDNEGGYCKLNCRWATRKEQCNNKRSNRMMTAFGKTQSVAAWATQYGMKERTLHNRLFRTGLSLEEAVSLPLAPPGLKLR